MTGFTYDLVEKKMDFATFVMRCARAFTPLIEMRDDPMDAVIPEKFEPSSYHTDELAKAQKEVARLKKMTTEQRKRFGLREKNHAIKSAKECLKTYEAENKILDDMLAQANAWTPPTPDHVNLKNFIVQQLTDSRHDLSWTLDSLKKYEATTPLTFFREALTSAKRDIEYHTEHLELDRKGAKFSTDWVQALRKSLAATA